MVILGIADSITSGAALVTEEGLKAAVNEERLNRRKMCMGFPARSIEEVMRVGGVEARDVDVVAVATNDLFWRPECEGFGDYFRDKKGGLRDIYLSTGAAVSKWAGNSQVARKSYYRLKRLLTKSRRHRLPETLEAQFGIHAPVVFVDHHVCHAASAYFTSGFDEALVVTQDGAGDGKCSRVFLAKDGTFEELVSLDSYDSVGNYYAYVTHLCGFKGHKHEGKITGLAGFGSPRYSDVLRRYVGFEEGRIVNRGRCFDRSAIEKLSGELGEDFSHADLSASIQHILEETVSHYCDYWMRRAGVGKVVLAGGTFANVKLNQRIHELSSVDAVFVHPGMGDEGLAVGAALFEENRRRGYRPRPVVRDVYLGGDFSNLEARRAILRAGLRVLCEGFEVEAAAARLLAEGRVVARCAGAMEYGPRALGNRSIFYQASDPSVNRWLNERLQRTEFMPFAPVTLWEERNRCFANLEGALETARFMTMTFNCTRELRSECPAVCHVDGTARPQLLRKEDNPSYYRILEEYRARTGLPCIVNTSFNIHEEPIVNTPDEAVKAFKQSRLDALILGDYLVSLGE